MLEITVTFKDGSGRTFTEVGPDMWDVVTFGSRGSYRAGIQNNRMVEQWLTSYQRPLVQIRHIVRPTYSDASES